MPLRRYLRVRLPCPAFARRRASAHPDLGKLRAIALATTRAGRRRTSPAETRICQPAMTVPRSVSSASMPIRATTRDGTYMNSGIPKEFSSAPAELKNSV